MRHGVTKPNIRGKHRSMDISVWVEHLSQGAWHYAWE